MKVIIIEEDRFSEILETLKYESEIMVSESSTPERFKLEPLLWREAVRETHRNFHYHLVKWMQSHGASCIKKL